MRAMLAGMAGAVGIALALVAGLSKGDAATAGDSFGLASIGSFAPDSPTFVTAPSGDGERLFVVLQQGSIRLVRSGTIRPTPFLTLGVACCGERGLLSMAFAPDYVISGLFYVYYTAGDGAITIDELRRSSSDPDVADPTSRRNVLTIAHPRTNHNGGQLQFGPDGYLYIGTGDGGGVGDPDLAGQDLSTLLGKILRIDPRLSPGGEPYTIPSDNPFVGQPPRRGEIWSYGLRNPWRFSFDRQTGDLAVADVGQSAWEEIDFSPRSSGFGRGTNYGWSCREGRHDYNPTQPLCAGQVLTEPVWEYSHARGCSITGGYVVRDAALPGLFGRYVYGDYCSSPLWSVSLQVPDAQGDADTGEDVSGLYSFGEDACARIYAASGGGPVFRLIPPGAPAPPATCTPVGGTLIGSVGPGFEISLRDPQGNDLNGRTLPAGTYTVQVDDVSDVHNFRIFGSGVQCVPPSDCTTDASGAGRETWLVNFTPGTVTYRCDPHAASMTGTFIVVGAALPPQPLPPPAPPPPVPPPPSPSPSPQPKPKPRYQATVRTTHPRAIRDRSRNWTYLGDTVRVAFRNAAAPAGERRRYTVCYTRKRSLACRKRTLRGRSWDAWRLRIRPPWMRYVAFTWRVSGRIVVRKRIWIYKKARVRLASSVAPALGTWRPAARAPGIVDVVGPRADGRLVLSTHGGLFLMRPGGLPTPFARGAQGYAGSPGEAYFALGSGHRVLGAGCAFRRDVIFVLDPDATPGILRVGRDGRSSRFADLPAGAFPSGITIDTVGSFGYRLLVTSFAAGTTTLTAFDCRGHARVVATGAPHVEGGIAVAPRTFGRFGGKLIAVDEVTGRIYAFGPRGLVRLVAESGLPAGGDVGVESVGFVPPKLGRRGAAYLADMGAPGSPTSGSDSLLILAGADLSRANLHPGELIVATEAGAKTIAVRCARRCRVRRVADGPTVAHAEGHITFVRRR